MSEQQTFANHRRFDPSYHFFFLPVILLAALTSAGVLAWRPSLHHALLLLAIITPTYSFHRPEPQLPRTDVRLGPSMPCVSPI
jgi:hypothetical protein